MPHHLHRIDQAHKRTHCWVVQIQRRGKIVRQVFSDHMHGGKQAAQRAALRYRDKLVKEFHDPSHALWQRNRLRRNNTSGVVGVGRYVRRDRRKRTEQVCWEAFWIGAEGRRHGRRFSVDTYGERRAKELAIRARRVALKALHDSRR